MPPAPTTGVAGASIATRASRGLGAARITSPLRHLAQSRAQSPTTDGAVNRGLLGRDPPAGRIPPPPAGFGTAPASLAGARTATARTRRTPAGVSGSDGGD